MLTQIEIDGFKTFKDFKVELAPFQVIVGPNGSGKSNLFDAMQLLSRLAEVDDLRLAFQAAEDDPNKLRGDAHELFTVLPNGERTNRVRIAVEMLVDRRVQDQLGNQAELNYTRLHYELEIALLTNQYGMEQFYITHEALRALSKDEDTWCKKYGLSTESNWIPAAKDERPWFISTTPRTSHTLAEAAVPYEANQPETIPAINGISIHLHSEGQGISRTFQAGKVKRTVLSSVTSVDFPHVFAAREEMRSWKFLHLNHEVLRQPSAVSAKPFLTANGGNLPTTLARIQTEDDFAFHMISSDMANLVPGILTIKVGKNQAGNEYNILAETADQRSFSAKVLSDGTLRLLALATLRNDPQFHGVLCLEEPENGVHPLHLKNMAHLLCEMATDFSDPQQVELPLRQVLITTHSPSFISQPDVIDSLLLAITPSRVNGKNIPPFQVTRMVPVATPDTLLRLEIDPEGRIAVEAYAIDMVRKYLDSDTLEEAQDQLKRARTSLSER